MTPLQLNPIGDGGPADLKTRDRRSLAHGTFAAAMLGRLAELSHPFGTALERGDNGAIIRG